MTTIGVYLGNEADKLSQASIHVGDVHFLNLDTTNGITPKNGDASRNKFFIVLGFLQSTIVCNRLPITYLRETMSFSTA